MKTGESYTNEKKRKTCCQPKWKLVEEFSISNPTMFNVMYKGNFCLKYISFSCLTTAAGGYLCEHGCIVCSCHPSCMSAHGCPWGCSTSNSSNGPGRPDAVKSDSSCQKGPQALVCLSSSEHLLLLKSLYVNRTIQLNHCLVRGSLGRSMNKLHAHRAANYLKGI